MTPGSPHVHNVSVAGRPLGFQRKLLLAFAAVLLPVLLLLGVDLVQDARATQETLLDAQALTAQAVAVQVNESFDAALELGWALANDPLVLAMSPGLLDPHLRQLAEQSSRLDAIGVYDATGLNRGWGDPDAPAEPRVRIADRSYFQQVMSTNAPVISEVLELRRPARMGMLVSVPVRNPAGEPKGVINLVLQTRLLEQRYLSALHGGGQNIFLVDPHGRLAFHTGHPSLPYARSNAFSPLAPIQAALAGTPSRLDTFTDPLGSAGVPRRPRSPAPPPLGRGGDGPARAGPGPPHHADAHAGGRLHRHRPVQQWHGRPPRAPPEPPGPAAARARPGPGPRRAPAPLAPAHRR